MTTSINRRVALKLTGGFGVGMATAMLAQGAAPKAPAYPPIPSWKTELRQLAPRVYGYTQAGGPGINNASISNAGVVVGDSNLFIVDALGPPILAKAFKASAEQATGLKAGRVVNTHYHRDHSNGDYLYEPAEIISHAIARELMISEGAIPAHPYDTRPEWQKDMAELRLSLPTTTLAGDATYYYHGITVQVTHPGPAHTWGDLMVFVPENRILFSGDVAFFSVFPACFNSHTTRWVEVINGILDRKDVETIVPGHGPIGGKAELADMRDFLVLLVRETKKRYDQGMTAGQAAADIDLGRYLAWGNLERLPAATHRLYLEYSGKLTRDRDVAGQAAATEEFNRIRVARGEPPV
jgi:glyoxylase-like metal-dependent hydrolase (beta-lactamase superfamily II)